MKKLALFGIAVLMAMALVISCENNVETKSFTVTFDTDGGSEIAPVKVLEGAKLTAPEAPIKGGHRLVEWQLEGKTFDFNSPITKDITLKAIWEEDATVWDGKAVDTSWYNETDNSFTLSKAADLAGLAKLVNEGNTFAKKTIALANDINLGKFEWTPIGTETNSFNGTFDGAEKTISNLKISGNQSNVGLFGYTRNGEIKNLTLHNANVNGDVEVGAVAGTPYTSKYTNIKLTGKVVVNGFSYVGGMFGKSAYANLTDLTVDVEEGSYVKAESENYRTYVGGVIGFMGEGNKVVTNATSNIDVIGSTCDVGGITGIAHYGNSFINCSSSGNVTLTSARTEGKQFEIGGISGVWMNSAAGNVTFKNCSFTGTLTTYLKGTDCSDKIAEANILSGTKYYPDKEEGKLIIEQE